MSLLMMINDITTVWKKYVPVHKAIKVIKKGLAIDSKISQKEFFFDDESYKDLKEEAKSTSSNINE